MILPGTDEQPNANEDLCDPFLNLGIIPGTRFQSVRVAE